MVLSPELCVLKEHIDEAKENCVQSAINAMRMYAANQGGYMYESNDDMEFEEIAESFADDFEVTEDFMNNFLNKKPGYVPSMKMLMILISCTELGAKAFNFIDNDNKIVDQDNNVLSGADAISYCLFSDVVENKEQIEYTKRRIADIFSFDIDTLYSDINKLTTDDIIKHPCTDVLEMCLLLDLSIQVLFNYEFYNLCDNC